MKHAFPIPVNIFACMENIKLGDNFYDPTRFLFLYSSYCCLDFGNLGWAGRGGPGDLFLLSG